MIERSKCLLVLYTLLLVVVSVACEAVLSPEEPVQLATLNITHFQESGLLRLPRKIIAAWEPLVSQQEDGLVFVDRGQIEALQRLQKPGTIHGLAELLSDLTNDLPRVVANDDWRCWIPTMSSIIEHANQTVHSLAFIEPSLHAPDITRQEKVARGGLIYAGLEILWSIWKSWVQLPGNYDDLLSVVAPPALDMSVLAEADGHLLALQHISTSAEGVFQLEQALTLPKQDFDTLLQALKIIPLIIANADEKTMPKPGEQPQGSQEWGDQHRTTLIQVCIDLYVSFGIDYHPAHQRCTDKKAAKT